MTVGDALNGLDPMQREAATALRGPVCVLAGAGTGKTRVITHRIAHGVNTGAYTPSRVMAVTFTAKAAGEMRGRLRALGVQGVSARTFHAAALAQLNFFWPTVAGDTAPRIVDNKVRVLAHAADGIGLRPDTATLRDVASEIEWRKVTMRSVEAYAAARPAGVGRLDVQKVVDLQRAYEKLKDARRQLDFEDVLLACAGMLEAEPRVARAVREQYRHFTVDEFQDVSPLQDRLLRLWLGARRDICVVGDASQTVYSFAGADASFLLDFPRRYPDARVVRLETNYRSTAAVLAAANTLMGGRPGALRLHAATAGAGERPVTVTGYRDDAAEADGIATVIARRIADGAHPHQFAVLYRAHAQSTALQAALADRRVPTTVLGGRRFFDMPEVRQAVLALRGASVAPAQADMITAVRDVLRSLGLTDDPPDAGGAVREAWDARRALLQLAQDAPAGTSLRAFTDDLMARAKDRHEPVVDAVTLSTLHAAKGLEWDIVHVAGMSDGLLPIAYATGAEQIGEERRLAYVGITRARRMLSLSWARRPSPFLREIDIHSPGGDRADATAGSHGPRAV